MKNFTLFLFACAHCYSLLAQKPSLHALFVGIDLYQDKVWAATGAKNDTKLLEMFFIERGVPRSNIQLLWDKSATKEGIVSQMENLKHTISPGDVVVFSFSGHGQQIADQNGDEEDGKDEAIVPYDSPRYNYTQNRLLTDDELETLLQGIRQKLGPKGHLLVLVDACYSGTMTKILTDIPFRGAHEVLHPEGWKNPNANRAERSVGIYKEENPEWASMMAFFACSPHETVLPKTLDDPLCDAIDVPHGSKIGPLTIAFYRVAISLPVFSLYQKIFSEVETIMQQSGEGASRYEGNDQIVFCNGVLQITPIVPTGDIALPLLYIWISPEAESKYPEISGWAKETGRYTLTGNPSLADIHIDVLENTLRLMSKTNKLYQNNINKQETIGHLKTNLLHYAQSRALFNLFGLKDSAMNADIKIQKCNSKWEGCKLLDANFLDFKAKDSGKIEIYYTGKDTAYFSILQMDSKGVVRSFWPWDIEHLQGEGRPSKRKLFPNMPYPAKSIEFSVDPIDKYLIFIITREPINFLSLIEPYVETPKTFGLYNPSEKKFGAWLSDMRKSSSLKTIPSNATIIPIKIKESTTD